MDTRYKKIIETLYLKLYPMLFEYARSSLPNDSLAEEAVQETFVIACRKPKDLLESPNPEGWIVNVLKYVIANMRRHQKVVNRLLTDYEKAKVDQICGREDNADVGLVYADIAQTEEYKLIQEMALEGRSYLEIAQERGITLETLRKRVQRARKKLRKKIEI